MGGRGGELSLEAELGFGIGLEIGFGGAANPAGIGGSSILLP